MEICHNNFFVKHGYYFKLIVSLIVSNFAFKPELGIMF